MRIVGLCFMKFNHFSHLLAALKKLQHMIFTSNNDLLGYKTVLGKFLELRTRDHSNTKKTKPKLSLVKTGLRGFRPGPTQTGLCNHRRLLEAGNFGLR